MLYTKVLYESRWIDIYWNSGAEFFKSYNWIADHWPCGCFWFAIWKLRINILYKEHK